MPSPTSALRHRPDLSSSLMEFDVANRRRNFVASQVLPVFEAGVKGGTFGRIKLASLLKQRVTTRNSRGAYNRGDFEFEDDSFATKEHGFEMVVDDHEAAAYAEYFDYEMAQADLAQDAVLENYEKEAADAVFNTSTWTGASLATAITNEWDDASAATPLADVEAAVQKVYAASGLWANALIINRLVYRNLRNCDQIVDRLQAAGAGVQAKPTDINPAMLASLFDLDYVIVCGESKNTANEGQATPTISQIWSNEYAMVCRIATTQNIKEPCLGRTFHWGGDGSRMEGTVERYRSEEVRGDVIRVRHQRGIKILYPQAGHLLSNITT